MITPMDDGLLPSDDPILSLEIFEGPLDLLLHLVKLNEINILDLPMGPLTEQYLSTLKALGKMELPLAGEYFVMAAELLRIKSQMLLPRHLVRASSELLAEESRGPDPRAELIRQLLDYQKLKTQAEALDKAIETQSLSYPCLRASVELERPLKPFDRFEVMGCYGALMRRLLERVAIGEIALDPYTVSQAIEEILARFESAPSQSFAALLKSANSNLPRMAALFVAILELARLGEVDLSQSDNFTDITLSRKAVHA